MSGRTSFETLVWPHILTATKTSWISRRFFIYPNLQQGGKHMKKKPDEHPEGTIPRWEA
jgi:hypothetical protein